MSGGFGAVQHGAHGLTASRGPGYGVRPTTRSWSFYGKEGNEFHDTAHRSYLVRNDDEGQGLAEYALILALIAIVAIIALIFLGSQVSTILNTVGSSV